MGRFLQEGHPHSQSRKTPIRDLGEHTLKDMTDPERVYEVGVTSLEPTDPAR